jgi:hypothetical protein
MKTQQTAMMQLRDRLQARCESDSCSEYEEIILDGVINCIDTELLAIEKQTLIDAFDYGFSSGYDDAQGDGAEFEDGQAYFNQTFNPK